MVNLLFAAGNVENKYQVRDLFPLHRHLERIPLKDQEKWSLELANGVCKILLLELLADEWMGR